jgi:tetratricopeptide (TPR) repeat protein
LRGTSPAQRTRHFEARGADEFRVRDHLFGKVEFTHEAIQEQLRRIEPGSLDLVLFRNVGIYLTPGALAEMLEGIQSRLQPGGLLLMAPTDPLPAKEGYAGLCNLDVGVYEARRASDPGPRTRAAPSRPRTPPAPRRASQATLDVDDVRLAKGLADRGRLDEALTVVSGRLRAAPNDEPARFFRAQVLLACDQFESALRDFDLVRSDHSKAALADYFAAMCLSNLGRTHAALHRLQRLEQRLSEMNHRHVLHEGYTAQELLGAVRSDLKRVT